MTPCRSSRGKEGGRAGTLLASLAVLALLTGCETRERNNPFDPRNPRTGGVPQLLEAVAGNRSVDLLWDLAPFREVQGIRILRRMAEDAEAPVWSESGPGSGSYRDLPLRNGVPYVYRLEIASIEGDTLYSASVAATPGASEPWFGDEQGFGIGRLSPDGRNLLFRVDGYREVLDLELDPADGSFWAADFGNGQVVHYDREGVPLAVWDCYGAAAVALDLRSGMIWVGSFLQRSVILFDRVGQEAFRDTTVGLVETVLADPAGGVWTGARDAGISRVDAAGTHLRVEGVSWPVALGRGARSDSAAWIWAVDRAAAAVFKISADGRQVLRSPVAFSSPRGGDADSSGGIWVVDPQRSGIAHLRDDLLEDDFLAVSGPGDAVTWDPAGRRLWVSISSQGRIEVLQVQGTPGSESDTVAASLDVGGRPGKVAALWR